MARENIKNKLPALLPGSEYKYANPNKHRAANLRGLAIAIVVRAKEQKVSKIRKRIWFTFWEKKRKEAQKYAMRRWECNYRRAPHNYAPPDKKNCKPERWGTRNWLRKSLFGEEVDWYRLHSLIFTELNQSPDHNSKWWRAVKDICEDITGFDPVAEILKISNEYVKPLEKLTEPEHIPSKMLGDTITIKGLPINWRVICDKLKKQLLRLRAFLHKEK